MDKFKGIHTNQRLLLEELESRGISVEVLIPEIELAEAKLGSHCEILIDRDSSVVPYAGSLIAADKYLTKLLLKRAGLPVPQGEQFFSDQIADMMNYISQMDPPFVVKPTFGSHGIGCSLEIYSQEDIEQAISHLLATIGPKTPFLIEKQILGMEIRVFINRERQFAALCRDPAYVLGDGSLTVKELVESENEKRANSGNLALSQILIDQEVERTLGKFNITLNSVPRAGAKIYLRRNSNMATGGVSTDVTDQIDDNLVELAFRALKAIPALPYAGIDILTQDITSNSSTSAILEINSNPGLKMHHYPSFGQGRNVAGLVADMIFPETRVVS